jgi:hypothetical protein
MPLVPPTSKSSAATKTFGTLDAIEESRDYVSSDNEDAPAKTKGSRPRTKTSSKYHSLERDNSDDVSEPEEVERSAYLWPIEIPFVVTVSEKLKIQAQGTCRCDHWTEAQRSWTTRCGYPMVGPLAVFPHFAFRYADQPKTSNATVIQGEDQYRSIVQEALLREEVRVNKYLNKGKEPPTSLKSKLPLTIMIVDPEPVTVVSI